MPSVTMDNSTLTIQTRKYSPPLPVNSSGWASMFIGMKVDIGPAAPPDDWFVFMNSLQSAAQCSSGVDRWSSNGKGLKRLL